MSDKIDIHVLELLASKICHDLISPVGAVANGVEFLEELEIEGADDIVELIQFSAKQGSAKLQAFRMAYGAGGADSSIKPEDVHKTFGGYIALDNKITQEWDPYGDLGYGDERPEAFCKILMCALLLGVECLPKGGSIEISAGNAETILTMRGEDSGIKIESQKALSLDIHESVLEPKHIKGFICGLLAKHYGYKITADGNDDGSARIVISHPA